MREKTPVQFRVIALLLCVLFFSWYCGPGLTAHAILTELAVGGVAIDLLSFVISVLIIALAGAGLQEAVNQAAASHNQTAKEFISEKFSDYVSYTGGSVGSVASMVAGGVRYLADGTLHISDTVGQWIYDFGNWLGTQDVDIPTSCETFELNSLDGMPTTYVNFPVYVAKSDLAYVNIVEQNRYYYFRCSSPCMFFLCAYNNGTVRIAASDSSFNYKTNASSDLSNLATPTNNCSSFTYKGSTVYYVSSGLSSAATPDTSFPVYNYSRADLSYYAGYIAWNMIYNATSTGATSGLDVWNNEEATDGYTMDPSGLLGDSVDSLAGAVANIGDYVNTLADVIAGIADITLPVAGVDPVPITIPADVSIPVAPAIPADVVDAVPATGQNTVDTPTGTDDFTLPLADFFPFCIPFDIYDMFTLFSASAEAPKFTLPFHYPGVLEEDFEIDLSEYDSQAAMMRNVETIVFCIGLAFVTKRLLFGS